MRFSTRKLGMVLAASGALSFGLVQAGMTGAAFAYGKTSQPLAQVEVSANCDNSTFFLCSPAYGGTGGIWYWVEIDNGGTGDASGARCGHTVGGAGGPGGAGAGSVRGPVTWSYSSLESAPPTANFFGTFDPNDDYYLVTFADGSQWLLPVSTGHYGNRLAPGVQIQITVAP